MNYTCCVTRPYRWRSSFVARTTVTAIAGGGAVHKDLENKLFLVPASLILLINYKSYNRLHA